MFERLKNSVVGKIVSGFAMILLVALVTTILGMILLSWNRNLDNQISNTYTPLFLELKETEKLVSESAQLTNNWVLQPEAKGNIALLVSKTLPEKTAKLKSYTNNIDSEVASGINLTIESINLIIACEKRVMNTLAVDSNYADDVLVDSALMHLENLEKISKVFATQMLKTTEAQAKALKEAEETKQGYADMIALLNIINIILFLLIGAFATFFSIRSIAKPIADVSNHLVDLSKGKFVEFDENDRKDEIGTMSNALSLMITGLKKKADFADSIGKGDYAAEFDLLSEDDTMGTALITMRENLKKAAEDDRKRNWAAEGLAKFAIILRNNHEKESDLFDDLLSNLVKYLGANQGGLFILDDTDPQDLHIKLVAGYAYERKKYLERRIEIGEGLVGQSYLEQESILMTEIPQEYISITSGLGSANPTSLLIVPLKINENVLGVVELASFKVFEPYQIEFVEKLAESLASAISSSKVNANTKRLLQLSQTQTEEMRAQEEEMRQNMEELQATQEEMERKEQDYRRLIEQLQNELKDLKVK
jgi:hypothetical protein